MKNDAISLIKKAMLFLLVLLTNWRVLDKIVEVKKDFVCKDENYRNCLRNKKEEIFFILDEKLLYKTLELIKELETLGYDKYGFRIEHGHRHPKYNEAISGAKSSKHIEGKALDIIVGDINKDWVSDYNDKLIVLELLDEKIVKDEGGIGFYLGTKMCISM